MSSTSICLEELPVPCTEFHHLEIVTRHPRDPTIRRNDQSCRHTSVIFNNTTIIDGTQVSKFAMCSNMHSISNLHQPHLGGLSNGGVIANGYTGVDLFVFHDF